MYTGFYSIIICFYLNDFCNYGCLYLKSTFISIICFDFGNMANMASIRQEHKKSHLEHKHLTYWVSGYFFRYEIFNKYIFNRCLSKFG